MNFKLWLENNYTRFIHNDGKGLMNNNALNYDKLSDDEYSDIEDLFLSLQQPPNHLHNQQVVFAFTPDGLTKHQPLINLLSKASKTGIKKLNLNPNNYQIVWQSNDGQIALIPKKDNHENIQ